MKNKMHPKTCPFYECLGKHVITKAKGCKYNGVKNDDELNDNIQAYLEETYPAYYPYQPQLTYLP